MQLQASGLGERVPINDLGYDACLAPWAGAAGSAEGRLSGYFVIVIGMPFVVVPCESTTEAT